MKNGWQATKLGGVCRLINGRAYKKPELLSEGKYPVLRVGNFFTNNNWYYSDMELDADKYCDTGDLLYAWSASFGPRIWDGGKVIYHYHIWKVEPNATLIDKRFLFLWFLWDTERIKEDQGTGTTMIHVAKGSMEDRDIAIPPLPEQRRIVGILDEAFAGIATAKAGADKNLQNARALFESHLNAVFTEAERKYSTKRLAGLCERITKGSSPKWQGISYVEKAGVLFVTSENVQENRVVISSPKYVEEKFNDKDKRSILRRGDVLTNLVGPSIGRTAVFDRDDNANINQAVGVITCIADVLHNYYLMFLFNSPYMKRHFHDNEVNNARANISLTFVKELEIPLPSVERQESIVTQIHEFHEQSERLEFIYQRKLAALDELKRSLLHQAFSGELTADSKAADHALAEAGV